MRLLSVSLLILCSAVFAFGQAADRTAQFNAAQQAYENGDAQQTIDLLAAYERSFGTSPRLESLRAMAYNDLKMPRETYKALLVYFKLTAGMDLSGNDTHRELADLRDSLRAQFEKEIEKKQEELEKQRELEADKIVAELENAAESRPGAAKPAEDPLAELEMWNKVKTSNNASDYSLFIETFPNGEFTQLARARMEEVGDPVWNEVKKSSDPFKYREYLKNYPNSVFADQARKRMNELAQMAIEWEQIRESHDDAELRSYVSRYPNSPYAAEASKVRAAIRWEKIKDSTVSSDFEGYLREFPDGADAESAKRILAASRPEKPAESPVVKAESGISNSISVIHPHSKVFTIKQVRGKLEFNADKLKYTEVLEDESNNSESSHNFEVACSGLGTFRMRSGSILIDPRGSGVIWLTPDENSDKVKAFVDLVAAACKLPTKK